MNLCAHILTEMVIINLKKCGYHVILLPNTSGTISQNGHFLVVPKSHNENNHIKAEEIVQHVGFFALPVTDPGLVPHMVP